MASNVRSPASHSSNLAPSTSKPCWRANSAHDIHHQLFDAAERVLLRDGPAGLTSRAVTTEAGCAKGVLHRHFDDFDGFLAELVGDRIARLDAHAAALLAAAGTGTVAGNLAA